MRKIINLILAILIIPFITKGQEINDSSKGKSKIEQSEETFIIVEKQPEYPGGIVKFYKYINKNLKYPKTAKRNGISGKIYVEFAINSNGTIDDKSVRSLSKEELSTLGRTRNEIIVDKDFKFEAVRPIRNCPDWKPAMQKGKPVKIKMIVPIIFKL